MQNYRLILFIGLCVLFGNRAHSEDTLGDDIARTISDYHYLHPSMGDLAGIGIDGLNDYLKTLDPYSMYFSPAGYREYKKNKHRIGIGIGVNIIRKGEKMLCVPYKDGPAFRSGLRRPAFLRGVNGKTLSFDALKSASRPKKSGRTVVLSVRDPIRDAAAVYRIKTGVFRQPSVEMVKEENASLIRIHAFKSDETAARMRGHVSSMGARGERIVLDLRYCIGGDLYEAVDAASMFLVEDAPMITLEDSVKTHERFNAGRAEIAPGRTVYLLVGNYTASACEIFSMVLRENKRALVIGELTEGKCLAQRVFELENESAIRLSVYEAFGPDHESCQDRGVAPHIEAPEGYFTDTAYLMDKGVFLTDPGAGFACEKKRYMNREEAAIRTRTMAVSLFMGKLAAALVEEKGPDGGWRACIGPGYTPRELKTLKTRLETAFDSDFSIMRPFDAALSKHRNSEVNDEYKTQIVDRIDDDRFSDRFDAGRFQPSALPARRGDRRPGTPDRGTTPVR